MTEKERLEKAREIYNNTNDVIVLHTLDELYPEFKETEDESIRKEIINFLELPHPQFVGKRDHEKWIAWLEKQGDKCLVNFDEAEQEKYDFVSGQYIECRASFNEFKEDNSYWLEYVGDDNYIGRSDNILNQKFHITPRQLFTLFTWQHCPKDNNVNDEANAPTGYGKYVDECLNEASKHFFSNGEDAYSVADLFYAGVRCGKSWFEKQSEQKSSTEVKPKFKQGEWIVWKDKYYKVNYNGCGYELFDQNGLSTSWDYKTIEDNAHLWTIQDAKDGDVLAVDWKDEWEWQKIVIFKSLSENGVEGYGNTFKNNKLAFKEDVPFYSKTWTKYLHPATKEQRDLLFAMMREAGYTFDFEKKEMKKIEEKTTDKAEPMFNVGDYIKHNKANIICKVISVNSGSYYVENIETSGRIELFNAEQNFHLWTIRDAKDGDVLHSTGLYSDCIFIYNGLDNWKFDEPNGDRAIATGYCCLSVSADNMEFGIQGPDCIEVNTVKPATKIQRDLLEKAMTDAGYRWNPDENKIEKIEQKPDWNKEDEEMLYSAIEYAQTYPAHRNSVVNWLKTLNPKSYWKPTEEQLDALMDAIQGFYACKEKNLLLDLYEQLKELKNE